MEDLLDTSLRTPVAPEDHDHRFFLVSLHPGTKLEAPVGSVPVTLGRDKACSLVLDESSVSRSHARIEGREGRFTFFDLKSKNGSFINRQRVSGKSPLCPGDVLRLGDVVLLLVQRSDEEAMDGSIADSETTLIGGFGLSSVRRQIRLLGPTPLRIMVCGESGTGKELAARELHCHSGRSGPFIAINCAALPESLVEAELFGFAKGAFTSAQKDKPGLFEAARGGTIFLDEVTELPLASQAKLLRVVESGEMRRLGSVRSFSVDCRIICATNQDLARAIEQRRFRADLAARLSEAQIVLLPLRQRREDLPLLIEHLGRRAGCSPNLSAEALEALACYPWPLNVRELDNTIRMLDVLARGNEVVLSMLPPHLLVQRGTTQPVSAEESRVTQVLDALRRNRGNIRKTSQDLGVSRTFVYRCLDRSGLAPADLRSGTSSAK